MSAWAAPPSTANTEITLTDADAVRGDDRRGAGCSLNYPVLTGIQQLACGEVAAERIDRATP